MSDSDTTLFSMPSSSGRNSLDILTSADTKQSIDGTLLAGIHIAGEFWQRGHKQSTDIVSDYIFEVKQALIDSVKFRALRSSLSNWIESRQEFEIDISADPDQKMSIYIGINTELIY